MSVSGVAASAAAQTLYPILVNDYLCFNAADVAKARAFINPYPTTTARSSASAVTAASSYAMAHARNARTSSGAAAPEYATYTARGVSRPLSSGARGTIVNILV
jgi:hypothetical protein